MSSSGGESKVETISRLGQWRIESFGPCSYRRSDPFKVGIWNWYISVEKNRYLYIRLFPEPSKLCKDQPPIAKFVLRVSNLGANRRPYISPNGTLRAHKSLLSASSPVFQSMFSHNLKEKESSTIDIDDMSLESCTTLLSYIYGTIKQADFWKHRLALLGAANKYDIADLKDSCEESLVEDINSGNVLERLQEAWLYQLDKLKKGCLTYLFDFGKIYDVRDEMNNFFRHADRELMVEMFQEVLTVWRPA
ncbi:hypothetical protein IFM89_028333 [Coptis chinensis]|uniref:BTB domain-containing protein n=1 Tax=Coptis chinensis TaxID=261450 RepID=A0A835I8K6_9MAGN|nr:hypothetical protein IFM89_028333 [Coptis chinensis]